MRLLRSLHARMRGRHLMVWAFNIAAALVLLVTYRKLSGRKR